MKEKKALVMILAFLPGTMSLSRISLNVFVSLSGLNYSFGRNKKIINYNYSEDEYEIHSRYSTYNLGLFAGLGITYFITPKLGIEAGLGSIGYGFSRTKLKQEVKTNFPSEANITTTTKNSGGLSLNPNNFTLGLTFYLGNNQ